ncbi:hypothetical protein F4809DRAFT_14165 [Biscogniauxia mediterranea]|nr:hypothetical protein F4809DRAFT_14165 [Biscogniauxia mediterranea]
MEEQKRKSRSNLYNNTPFRSFISFHFSLFSFYLRLVLIFHQLSVFHSSILFFLGFFYSRISLQIFFFFSYSLSLSVFPFSNFELKRRRYV